MPADPEDRERLAREVAEEITNALVPPFRGMSLIARQHLVEKVAQRVAAAFERVREPLEKELEEWRGLQPTFKAAMERLSSEFQQLEADADSLRSQLSEAKAELAGCDGGEDACGECLPCYRRMYRNVSKQRSEAQQRIEILLNQNQEIAQSNADHVGWQREAQQRVERLEGALREIVGIEDVTWGDDWQEINQARAIAESALAVDGVASGREK